MDLVQGYSAVLFICFATLIGMVCVENRYPVWQALVIVGAFSVPFARVFGFL